MARFENLEFYLIKKENKRIDVTKFDGDIIKKQKRKITVTNDKVSYSMEYETEIPHYSYVESNRGHSYCDPTEDKKFSAFMAEKPDGVYLAGFESSYYRTGWARGSNWYGVCLYRAK